MQRVVRTTRSGAEVRRANAKSPLELRSQRASFNNPGDFLLSHTVTRAVPSAPAGLTSVFGMGTGVTLPTKSPENRFEISGFQISRFQISDLRSQISKRSWRIE
jgi:hypothetical protein